MTKPSTSPAWGSDPSTPIETPPAGVISGGWRVGRKPSHKHVNWWWNLVGTWIDFFGAFFLADKSATFGRLTSNGDPGGSGKGFFFRVPSLGFGFEVDGSTSGFFDDNVSISVGRSPSDKNDLAINVWGKTTILAYDGIEINGSALVSLGVETDTAVYTVHASPASGGYTEIDANPSVLTPITVDDAWQPVSPGGGQAKTWRAPVRFHGTSLGADHTLTNIRVIAKVPAGTTDVMMITLYEVTSPGYPVTRTAKASFARLSGGSVVALTSEKDTGDHVAGDTEIQIHSATIHPDRRYYVEIGLSWHSGSSDMAIQGIAFDLTKTSLF